MNITATQTPQKDRATFIPVGPAQHALKKNGSSLGPYISQILLKAKTAYTGDNFLGKCIGEKEIQLKLAGSLLNKMTISSKKPVTFVDYGCGDGWFSRAIVASGLVHKKSKGYLYDPSLDQCAHAIKTTTECKSLSVHDNASELEENLSSVGRADIVFMNMVDICQENSRSLEDLFRAASKCLKIGGAAIITTQNPLARPGKFRYYETQFLYPDRQDRRLVTRVEGVDVPLIDYHRPLHKTLGSLCAERFKSIHLLTSDDDGKLEHCNLSLLGPKDNGRNDSDNWVPALTISNTFNVVLLNTRGRIEEMDEISPNHPITLDKKAPYLGIASLNA